MKWISLIGPGLLLASSAFAQDVRGGGGLVLSEGKFGKALDARIAGAVIDGDRRFREPPITVECWAKLLGKSGYNLLVASDVKESGQHWEIFTRTGTGEFAAFLPGWQAEIHSGVDVCDGQWHYLAMTHDGIVVRLFVDGKQAVERRLEKKIDLISKPGALTIGMVLFGKEATERLGSNGLIDEVRISQGVRKIAAIPREPLPRDPLTIALWRFDEDEQIDPAWTPRPIAGAAFAWQKETDADWVDGRLQAMDTGPFFNATIAYPAWSGETLALRGTAIRIGDKGQGTVLFERGQLRLAAGWTGGFLEHKTRRFGLLNTPKPAGKVHFTTNRGPGWADAKGNWTAPADTLPLPAEWASYRGLHLHGKRVVLEYSVNGSRVFESPWLEGDDKTPVFSRNLEIAPALRTLHLRVCDLPGDAAKVTAIAGIPVVQSLWNGQATAVALVTKHAGATLETGDKRITLAVAPHAHAVVCKLLIWSGEEKELPRFVAALKDAGAAESLQDLLQPGPQRWQELVTRGELGADDAAYVVDTLVMPYDNPFKALLFLTGVDFLPDNLIAVSSAHGDVWLVKGVDDKLARLGWQRFATGMYQPLGLRVVAGKVHVLERGQLTRLHDLNADGLADFYENVNSDWHIAGGEHSFDTCLETDPDGNFYFFNTGDADTPTGGCLLRVSADGKKREIFATGFRHPIGLGVSPTGIVTGADQQGNWMPATRVDQYRQGGFYGDMRTHQRKVPPRTYDPPICWLPQQMDNSAGGQVWVPVDKFGPLSGQLLHFSWGRGRLLPILRQQVDDVVQGGAFDLGLQFLAGVARGRFRAADGHLYVAGLDGWQTAALRDGCLQRVRYTGKQVTLPTALAVGKESILLQFSEPLDRAAADPKRFHIEQWNYRWSADYGSKHWSVRDPKMIGQDAVAIASAELGRDGQTVVLRIPGLTPVMQMQIDYRVKTAAGAESSGQIYNTINSVPAR